MVRKSPWTTEKRAARKQKLGGSGDAGALLLETLTGEYEPQPYQFVAPVQITPAVDGTMYALITHWSSASAIEAWRESAGYRLLPALGDVSSATFVPASVSWTPRYGTWVTNPRPSRRLIIDEAEAGVTPMRSASAFVDTAPPSSRCSSA